MSLAEPAARSAALRARAHTSGARTGIGETTESNSLSTPLYSPASATSMRKPSATRPAERSGTFTRTPGTAASASSGGIR